MEVETVGDLRKVIANCPDDMPLWITTSCYEHDGRVFTEVRPDMWHIGTRIENEDGSVEVRYRGIPLSVRVEEREIRSFIKSKKSNWKYEYKKFLHIKNACSDDMVLDED